MSVEEDRVPDSCPSCDCIRFVGQLELPATVTQLGEYGRSSTLVRDEAEWVDCECEDCGKKIVSDGHLLVDDSDRQVPHEETKRLDEYDAETE